MSVSLVTRGGNRRDGIEKTSLRTNILLDCSVIC